MYNPENLLKKIIKVQEIVLEQKRRGVSQLWVYENLIREPFFISYSTYNRWLAVNAKRKLKELEMRESERKAVQLELFEGENGDG